jgi:hypothetical protein
MNARTKDLARFKYETIGPSMPKVKDAEYNLMMSATHL